MLAPVRKLAIVANCGKPRAADVLRRIAAGAAERGIALVSDAPVRALIGAGAPLAEEDTVAGVDAVLALGGDGTMLRAVRAVNGRPIPVLGVNIGGLGFLTTVAEEELDRALTCLATGQGEISRVGVLACTVRRAGRELARYRALNEVVVSSGPSYRVITLDVSIDDDSVTSYVCDGLIVATPSGSTGHSLSAGGPILSPETPALVLSLICPHTLSWRPLVVPDRSAIAVTVAGSSAADPTLNVDGQMSHGIRRGDTITVTRSPDDACFVRLPGYSYFNVLRRKLRWSGSNIAKSTP